MFLRNYVLRGVLDGCSSQGTRWFTGLLNPLIRIQARQTNKQDIKKTTWFYFDKQGKNTLLTLITSTRLSKNIYLQKKLRKQFITDCNSASTKISWTLDVVEPFSGEKLCPLQNYFNFCNFLEILLVFNKIRKPISFYFTLSPMLTHTHKKNTFLK